mmetsp:Transcript_1609/g.4832  ORF Transcript_1609/g.4832 Transcript_1609/m.4832 type:complete len:125 (-) Transcript_1609:1883-2257(-)
MPTTMVALLACGNNGLQQLQLLRLQHMDKAVHKEVQEIKLDIPLANSQTSTLIRIFTIVCTGALDIALEDLIQVAVAMTTWEVQLEITAGVVEEGAAAVEAVVHHDTRRAGMTDTILTAVRLCW